MQTEQTETTVDLNEQLKQRREKLKALRGKGNAYPNDARRDALSENIHQHFDTKTHEELDSLHHEVNVAGRIMLRRLMGKASFVHIQDMTGQIQLYVKQDDVGPEVYEEFKHWDLGDIIHAQGVLFKTKTGELSVKVTQIKLVTKSLRPLPDKYHGLTDIEMRYRQRYVDLIMNPETRKTFKMRFQIIHKIREFLLERNFMEVETPMMQPIPGGATARPFVTHHNALDMELFLRIAPELYLKRLVVGGFERVFEINRNFRNEGLSTRHNPEFTMLEFYQAYADYHDLIDLTETLMRYLAKEVLGTTLVTYQGETFDLSQAFARMTVKESILHFNPNITLEMLEDITKIRALAEQLKIHVNSYDGIGKIQFTIFEETVEHKLIAPTFITAHPTEISPLARCNDKDPTITDRFEFFVGGREVANGFSELNDPEDQAERFKAQVSAKDAGDQEAMHYDADYVNALEYGMPPTAGEGIGIDRLVMLFTDQPSIRDVILFPHMRRVEE